MNLPKLPSHSHCGQSRAKLLAEHTAYCQDVSSRSMAISLESAAYLYSYCELNEPKVVLNLGSGFSSYLFRLYSSTNSCKVICVDDDPEWLARTREYLESHSLTTNSLETWHTFAACNDPTPDLIFHDLGRMPVRLAVCPFVLEWASRSDGIVFLDDVHKSAYSSKLNELLSLYSADVLDLRDMTLDNLGRWMIAAHGLIAPECKVIESES